MIDKQRKATHVALGEMRLLGHQLMDLATQLGDYEAEVAEHGNLREMCAEDVRRVLRRATRANTHLEQLVSARWPQLNALLQRAMQEPTDPDDNPATVTVTFTPRP